MLQIDASHVSHEIMLAVDFWSPFMSQILLAKCCSWHGIDNNPAETDHRFSTCLWNFRLLCLLMHCVCLCCRQALLLNSHYTLHNRKQRQYRKYCKQRNTPALAPDPEPLPRTSSTALRTVRAWLKRMLWLVCLAIFVVGLWNVCTFCSKAFTGESPLSCAKLASCQ